MGLPGLLIDCKFAFVKSVALTDLAAQRDELLGGLAQGEVFAVTDAGQRIATLIPSPMQTVPDGNVSVFDLMTDLVGMMIDGPADLSNKKKHLADFGLDGSKRRKLE